MQIHISLYLEALGLLIEFCNNLELSLHCSCGGNSKGPVSTGSSTFGKIIDCNVYSVGSGFYFLAQGIRYLRIKL